MRSMAAEHGDAVRRACENIDRAHTGRIARQDFRRVLNDFGLVMTDVAFRRATHFVNASKVWPRGQCGGKGARTRSGREAVF